MTHVHEINDVAELARHRPLWESLLGQTRGATFFQSLDWLETYWRHFGPGSGPNRRLRVLIVYADDKPIGILPLVVREESTRAGSVRVLTYPLDNWGSFYGPIGPNPTATLRAAVRHVRRSPRDWDLVDLRWVDRSGCDHGRTPSTMQSAGFAPKPQAWDQTAVVEMTGTWDEYWQSRSPKWRADLRRHLRHLSRRGEVSYVRYRPKGIAHGDGDPRWDLYRACVRLARRSWQGDSATGNTLCHKSVARFLRDAHKAAARSGSLDLNLLLVDGRPVAFIYNYHHDGRVYGLRMGFDPEWAGGGVGRVLQWRMFQDSFERGDTHFDMGAGSLECKHHWWTGLSTSWRYTHFAPTAPQAQLLRLKRWWLLRRHGETYLAGSKSKAQGA